MTQPQPPKWAQRFLNWYCNPRFLEEIEGDIYELYERRTIDLGIKKANYRFIWDVFRFLRWSNIKQSNSKYTHMQKSILFKNYIKLGIRNIFKNLVTSSINIFGLALAIGVAITTFVFVDMQLNMDNYHVNGERVYQITNYVDQAGNNRLWGDSPLLLGPQMMADNPAIENFARQEYATANVKFEDDVFEELITFVDPSIVDILDFPLQSGNIKSLDQKHQIIISQNMAIKYFNYEDPIGKELSLKFTNGVIKSFTVGAVMEKFPYNCSIRDDFYIPIENFFDLKYQEKYNWSYLTDATLIMLKEGEEIEKVESQYERYKVLQNSSNPDLKILKFEAIPLTQLSQRGHEIVGAISGGGHPGGRIAIITISFLLLGMACFNFMNISVTASTKRLKEIALRKVMGGHKKQVISQFLTENILQCVFALVLGILLAYFFLTPGFDSLVPQMEIKFRTNAPTTMVIFLFSLLIAIGLISGSYPAFYIAKFEPIAILKGSQKLGSSNSFSKVMLGFQFFLATITIVSCFVITDQSLYLTNKDWGYNPKGTISVWVANQEQFRKLESDVNAMSEVNSYTSSNSLVGRSLQVKSFDYEDRTILTRTLDVGNNYMETMGLRLLKGRFLTNDVSAGEKSVVVNEKFIDQLGWKNDPINQTFLFDSIRYTIVGVVQDFHYSNFFDPIDPVIIRTLEETHASYITMKTTPAKIYELESRLRKSWSAIAPNDPFDRVFQEDVFDDFYIENSANIKIMMFISGFAILLACLGLYGLLSFNIRKKLKEFSIRKVLGATPSMIVKIAAKQYTIIIFISFFLGAPIGAFAIIQLIKTIFPDPKALSPLPFIVAIVIICLTLTLTVIGQIIKAIKVNPANILRSE